MAVYKDKWNGYDGEKWRVSVYYKDWQGIRKKHEKRGFHTKKEALAYEREFIAKTSKDINMGFGTFIDIYMSDMKPQLKRNTYLTKENIINSHIRGYFENRSLASITATDILQWQNELLSQRDDDGKGYSQTYLRTIQNQLNAIFNHAVKYYDLPKNPCLVNKKMGKSNAKEMLFWTKDEYLKFAEAIKDKPVSYYAFQLLYWTGIRLGELLALTKSDFDFEKKTMRIDESLQILKGEVVITDPKTEKSKRVIELPDFLCEEMQDYFEMLYKVDDNTRIFDITKSYLHHEMDRGHKKAGVKRIRVHDLRHSSCALLIELGYSPIQIAERLGHESVTITQRYSHLYPSVQRDMANSLNAAFVEENSEDAVILLLGVSISFIMEAFMEHMGDTLSLGVAIYAATTIAFFSHQLKCWISWNYVGAFAFIYCAYIFTRVLVQMENEKVKMIIMKCLIGAAGLLGAVKFILFVFAMRKG